MKDIIEKIKDEFNRIKDSRQEANLQHYVIINTFLKYSGYDMKHLNMGKRIVKGFCDIYVPTVGEEALIIEVKNGKKPLEVKDISQAINYAEEEQQRFSILTNGYEYVLLDRNIDANPKNHENKLESYIVFWFNIFNPRIKGLTELKFFKYLSFENLYENKTTHFYADIARYREWKLEQGMKATSWTAYRCTLYQFFDLYAQENNYKTKYESNGKKCYEKLDIDDFNKFISECKRHKRNSSIKTIENNFSHIYNMLRELQKHGRINHIILSDSRMLNLSEYEKTEKKKIPTTIKKEDIQLVINFYEKGKDAYRNIVAFLLTISLGLERSQLMELKWGNLDKCLKNIIIDDRKIEVCALLHKYLLLLDREVKAKKSKSQYILQNYSNGKYIKMSESGINEIFDKLKKMTNDSKWKDYSPKYLRGCLILSLFEADYPLEEILYITGIDLKNISNYITMSQILEKNNKKLNWQKLYDGVLCDTSL